MFEEYQFLRYYIPGSLYVIYTTILLFPLLSTATLIYLKSKPDVILGVFGAAFAGSLAFGYIIYTIYDSYEYTSKTWGKKKPVARPLVDFIDKKVEDFRGLSEAKRKMIIEMLHTYESKSDSGNCNRYYSIGRGFWSHYNARLVCSFWVPILSILTVEFLFFVGVSVKPSAVSFDLNRWAVFVLFWGIGGFLIGLLSFVLRHYSKRPFAEAVEYENLFIKKKLKTDDGLISEVKVLIELAKETESTEKNESKEKVVKNKESN